FDGNIFDVTEKYDINENENDDDDEEVSVKRNKKAIHIFDICHSYCLTVHKCQGSEYKSVCLYIPYTSDNIDRNFVYTAITRAKNNVVIVHSKNVSLEDIREMCRRKLELPNDYFGERIIKFY